MPAFFAIWGIWRGWPKASTFHATRERRPQCDWSRYGLAFLDYNDAPQTADPRERLKWVAFKQPRYDGNGATIETEIMHGPLAGIGYECRLHSGVAGWTVGECKTSWVS